MLRQRIAFMALLLAATMDHLDGSIVNVVLPVLQSELGADASAAQWISSGYTIAFGLFLVTSGRLGDLYGRKRLLLVGVAGFTLSSVMCGLAAHPAVMIAARAAQGLCSAAMVPQILALVHVLFPERSRGKALGVYAAVTGLASVGGQLLGAVLTAVNLFGLGWRAVFLINVPAGMLVWAIIAPTMPEARERTAARADTRGVLLATATILLITAPLTLAHQTGWSAGHSCSIATGVGTLWLLLRRVRAHPATAVVPPHLFRRRPFTGGVLVTAAVFLTIHAFFFTQVLYLQHGLGASVLDTALITLPWAIGTACGAGVASSLLVPRWGDRVLDVGLVVFATGFASVALGLSPATPDYAHWAASLAVAGLGSGSVIAPVLGLALRAVPDEDAATASGLISSAQQVGGAFGAAALGAVFFATWHEAGPTTAFRTVVWCGVAVLLVCAVLRITWTTVAQNTCPVSPECVTLPVEPPHEPRDPQDGP